MNWFNMLARWIVVSSADPSEISLTIKGVLVGLVPWAMVLIGLTHLNVGQDQLNAVIDGSVNVVQYALMFVSAVLTFVGMVRKLWNTIKVHQQATGSLPTQQ